MTKHGFLVAGNTLGMQRNASVATLDRMFGNTQTEINLGLGFLNTSLP